MIVPYARFYENKSRKYVNRKRYRLGNPNHPCYDYYKQHGMDKTLDYMKITGVNSTNYSKRLEIYRSSSRKGDFAEYYAVTWLWDQGYEVFKNAGCSGPIDMIAMKDGEVTLIDVKTFQARSDGQRVDMVQGIGMTKSADRTAKQKKMGVKLLGFNPETRELRFVEHRNEKSD